MPRPVLLRPEAPTLRTTRWGGHRLGPLRGAPDPSATIGESWELSTMPGAQSRCLGRPLSEVLGAPLPFLAKLIDTAKPLSIQVHPTDDPSRGASGKEEAWVILDADPDARVLVGVRDGVSAAQLAEATHAAIATPDHDAVLIDLLESVPVSRGTVIVVPSGTVHAIGPGILLAEIQQPADCTFRLFDYGSGRPIHPEQALAATRVDARPQIWRPSDGPVTLCGQHVRLRPIVGGSHAPDVTPALAVGVQGSVHATRGDETELLAAGDLALLDDPAVRIHAAADAVGVVGWIGDPTPDSAR